MVLKEVQGEISIIREKLDSGLSNIGSQSGDTTSKVKELQDSIDDITEKVWELDKSWKNNLVFYGIKQDAGAEEHPSITEAKVCADFIAQTSAHYRYRCRSCLRLIICVRGLRKLFLDK